MVTTLISPGFKFLKHFLWIVERFGFDSAGVRKGSPAAGSQGVVYGDKTRGVFSKLQSAGQMMKCNR